MIFKKFNDFQSVIHLSSKLFVEESLPLANDAMILVIVMENLIKYCPFVSRLPNSYIRKVNNYLPKYAELCPVMSKMMDHHAG